LNQSPFNSITPSRVMFSVTTSFRMGVLHTGERGRILHRRSG
jgi:hypothetical protein